MQHELVSFLRCGRTLTYYISIFLIHEVICDIKYINNTTYAVMIKSIVRVIMNSGKNNHEKREEASKWRLA